MYVYNLNLSEFPSTKPAPNFTLMCIGYRLAELWTAVCEAVHGTTSCLLQNTLPPPC